MPTQGRRNVVVKDEAWNKLKALAEKEETNCSVLIREALRLLFRTRENKTAYDPTMDRLK